MAVHIKNPQAVEEKLSAIREDGITELHVVSDFDGTLTKAFVEGQKAHTVIAQLREGGYLTADYPKRAFALYDKYHPIELDESLPLEEKNAKMSEWWSTHLQLMIECGMNRDVVEDIIKNKKMTFRDSAFELLDALHEKNIPLLIFSAALGDAVEGYLRDENKLYDNIHVISNFYEYNNNGKVTGYKDDIVHTFNKNETHIRGTSYEPIIRERKNVLLLGNTLGDLGMTSGFEHDTVLRIGFLNENPNWHLPLFNKEYDVVITGDGSMDWVLEIVKGIA